MTAMALTATGPPPNGLVSLAPLTADHTSSSPPGTGAGLVVGDVESRRTLKWRQKRRPESRRPCRVPRGIAVGGGGFVVSQAAPRKAARVQTRTTSPWPDSGGGVVRSVNPDGLASRHDWRSGTNGEGPAHPV